MESYWDHVNYLSWDKDGEDYQTLHHSSHQQAQDTNLLMEKPLLGLNLTYSESLEDMLTFKLNQTSMPKSPALSTRQVSEKLKASNFPISTIVIGNWKWESKNEGDLVAKCYFAKKKLVWEMLDKGLKSKIEIQWTDILSLSPQFHDNGLAILNIELEKPPTFYREIDPQPRKHTQWRLTSDFTKGQASLLRRHALYFSHGTLEKHFEKLVQSSKHLYQRSQVPFPSLESPFFDTNAYDFPSMFYDTPDLNQGFYLSYTPNPRQQHTETHRYHQSLSDLSSPLSGTSYVDERTNNMQTQLSFQDQSQNNMPYACWSQLGDYDSTTDCFIGQQANILESSPVPVPAPAPAPDEYYRQGFGETTVKTAAPTEEYAIQDEESDPLMFSYSQDKYGYWLEQELQNSTPNHMEGFESSQLYPQPTFFFSSDFSFDIGF